MPFALPEYDQAFTRFVHSTIHDLARARSPLLGKLGVDTTAEAAASVVDSREGGRLDLPAEPIEYGLTMKVEAVRQGDFEPLYLQLDSASEELGRALVEMFVKTMDKVTEQTGNVVKANGAFTFESIYEALDQREWSLDDDDQLSIPDIFTSPEGAKSLPNLTPEQEAMLDELFLKKHKELLAGRRSRRLS